MSTALLTTLETVRRIERKDVPLQLFPAFDGGIRIKTPKCEITTEGDFQKINEMVYIEPNVPLTLETVIISLTIYE